MLIYDNLATFEVNFNELTRMKTFSLDSMFMIYLQQRVDDTKALANRVFNILLKKYIYFALVVLPLRSNSTVNLYNVIVYNLNFFYPNHKDCYNDPLVNELDICRDGEWTYKKHLNSTFPWKPDMYNCSIDILTTMYQPFVIAENIGFEIDLLRFLEPMYNFTFNVIIDKTGSGWGVKKKNGWTGRLRKIQENSIFGISNLVVDDVIAEDFSYSTNYYSQRTRWITPIPLIIPDYKVIFSIFKLKVWAVVLATYLAYVLLFYKLSFGREYKKFKLIGSILINVFGVYIGTGVGLLPRTTIMRFIIMSLAMLSLILTSFYTTLLISFLTEDRFEDSYDSTTSVLYDSNLKIGGLTQYTYIFEDSNNKNDLEVLRRYEKYEDEKDMINYWMKRVAEERNTATVLNTVHIQYAIATNNPIVCYPDGQPKIHIGTTEIYVFPNRIVSSKNNLLLKVFDKILPKLISNGFTIKWMAHYLQTLEKAEFILQWNREKSSTNIVFTFQQVEGAFLIFIVGNSLGLIAFFAEIIVYECIKRKTKREKSRLIFVKKMQR